MKLPDALTPLRDRRFAWLYAGVTSSVVGSTIAPIALTFAVLDLTANSASALGVVLAARSIPLVLFVLVGGVVADRLPRSLVLRVSNLASALTQAAVAALLLTGTADLWMLVTLEAVNGMVAAFTFPAVQGIIPQIAPRSHLQQANAMMSFSRGGMRILGPSIGALLVVTAGSGWAIAIDACTWLVASGCMSRLRVPTPRSSEQQTSGLHDLRDGWSAFTAKTWVWVVVAAFALLNAIQAGAWGVLGPVIAESSPGLGARGWGLVVSAQAAGAIGMTLLLLRLPLNRPLRQGMVGVSVMAIPLCLLGIRPETLLLAAAALLGGAGIEIFGTGWRTALMEQVPPDALSRVASFDMLGSFIAIPAGTLLYGWLVTRADLDTVLIISAIAYATAALATLLVPSVRRLRRLVDSATTPDHDLSADATDS